MDRAARRNFALAAITLATYAACAATTPAPETAAPWHDKPLNNHAATIDTAASYEIDPPPRARAPRASRGTNKPRSYNGDLPPLHVILCESGGRYDAENPTSSASGRYQIVDGSWNGYGGYSHASDAPPDVQDAKARAMWANGAGASHWRACL